jgi:hypothetical protein
MNSDNRLSGTFCFVILYGLMVEILNFKSRTAIIKLIATVTNFNVPLRERYKSMEYINLTG